MTDKLKELVASAMAFMEGAQGSVWLGKTEQRNRLERALALLAEQALAGEPTMQLLDRTQIMLTTEARVSLRPEEYNKLLAAKGELHLERTRKIRAYQLIRSLVGGVARDFNELEPLIDADEAYKLSAGIAITVSEADKNWIVPLAHEHGFTLGTWMQKVFDKWIEHTKSPAEPRDPAAKPAEVKP